MPSQLPDAQFRSHSPRGTLAPGRSNAAVIAVLVLVLLAGVAVYAVVSIASPPASTPTSKGTPLPPVKGGAGTPGSEVLLRVAPLMTDGKHKEALALLDPAIEATPDVQDLRLARARVYSDQKEWKKSYADYEAGIAIGPETASLHAEAGTVANVAGYLERSIEHFERAKTLDPKDHRHPLYLAMVQIKADKDQAAMANLLTAAVLNPELAEAWGVMGELELRANHLDLALQHLEKARKIQPESLKWRLAEAKVHKRQNEPGKSLDLLINLPDKERYSADTIPVVVESLAMLKQKDRQAEYLKAAQAYAQNNHDVRAIAEVSKYADTQP